MNAFLPIALAVVSLVLSVGLALYARALHRRLQAASLLAEEQAQGQQALTEQLGQLTAGEVGVGRLLTRAQRELVTLRGRVDELESAQQSSAPYATAIRMAEQGAGVDGVMDACGLSEAEAELLLKLHSARSDAQQSH